jgi:hypothetical protein
MGRTLALPAVLLLASCISFSGLDPKSNYAEIGRDSIIVLGVSPRYRVHIFEGERVGEKWNRDEVMVKLNVYPENGYIVAKLSPRSGRLNYGIGGILPEGIGGQLFHPCQGRRTMTFDAPEGKVVYVGDVTFVHSDKAVRYEASSNFAAAREHLRSHYPVLADRLIDQGFEHSQLANRPCGPSSLGPIMIQIPSFRR